MVYIVEILIILTLHISQTSPSHHRQSAISSYQTMFLATHFAETDVYTFLDNGVAINCSFFTKLGYSESAMQQPRDMVNSGKLFLKLYSLSRKRYSLKQI